MQCLLPRTSQGAWYEFIEAGVNNSFQLYVVELENLLV